MKKQIVLTVLAAMLSVAASGQAPARPSISPEYTPVHDPVVAFCDGKYYMFSTGMGISVMSSDDMKNWRPERQVLNPIPEWAVKAVPGYNGHTWAPDIIYHNGLWYLYYSCSTFASNGSCIDYIFMHGYDKTRRYNSMLITRQIIWDNDGWPIINL